MIKRWLNQLLVSFSDNPKAAIQKRPRRPKWVRLIAFVLACALCEGGAQAQHPEKVFRIGFLDTNIASDSAVLVDVFRRELNKLGWIEGKNIVIEYRFWEGKPERYPELVADVIRLKVDLIVVGDMGLARAAKIATTTIPIVIVSLRTPWAEVWLPVWRGREATSPGTRLCRPS